MLIFLRVLIFKIFFHGETVLNNRRNCMQFLIQRFPCKIINTFLTTLNKSEFILYFTPIKNYDKICSKLDSLRFQAELIGSLFVCNY